ncbi:MAG: DNA double-strand break repair nuclease NurA [Candidatus Nanoarchaeia archaeon]
MKRELVMRIIDAVKPKQIEDESISVRRITHIPVKISDDFKPIGPAQSSSVLFIDGGNQEIISTPGISLQFIRTYYTIYKGNRRIKTRKEEFYALIQLDDDKIASAEFFDSKIFTEVLSLELDDFNPSVSTLGNLVRRLSELRLAKLSCGESDYIVLDGSFFAPTRIEQEFVKGLLHSAQEKGTKLAALSKTSSLVTDRGRSVQTAIRNNAPDGCWIFPLIGLDDPRYKAELSLVKLHQRSQYIFILETQGDDPSAILKENSTDPVFRGYPYGLIEADQFARVSNAERDMFRMAFLAKAGNAFKELLEAENALNAHSILDAIR